MFLGRFAGLGGISSAAGFPVGALLVACLAIAGCANNDLSSLQTAAVADGGAAQTETASAYGSSKPKPEPFNPFRDLHDAGSGGRQIIAKPSLAEVMKTGSLAEMSLGRADAPVTVVKYASLTCPHCRRFQSDVFPKLKRNYIDTGKVRFVIREFPIGRSSGNATIALRCAPEARYFELYSKFLAQQGRWVSQDVRLDNIHAVAQQVGLSRAAFDACLENQTLLDGLKWVKDRGRTLGIIGTPNFFIQDTLVKKVLDYGELAALIDAELQRQKAVAAAN